MTLKPNIVTKPCNVENCQGTVALKLDVTVPQSYPLPGGATTTWTCDTCGHSEPYPPAKSN